MNKILFESFDKFAGILTDETMNFVRRSKIIYDKDNSKNVQKFSKEYSFPQKIFFEVVINRVNRGQSGADGLSAEFLNGKSKIIINIDLDPIKEPYIYQSLAEIIKDTIQHEIEHKTQMGKNRIPGRPFNTRWDDLAYATALENEDFFSYFTNKMEVPAYAKQMYTRAKYYKASIDNVIDVFLLDAVIAGYITYDQREKIKQIWLDEVRKRYPAAKFSEEKISLKTVLLEIKLDGFVSRIANDLLQYIKKTKEYFDLGQEKKYGPLDKSTGYRSKEFNRYEQPLDFTLYVALNRHERVGEEGYFVDGSSDNSGDDDNILISVALDPNKEPTIYSSLLGNIKDTLRHEMEHLTQDGINRIEGRETPVSNSIRNKIRKHKTEQYKYFILKDEIPAMIKGMKTLAKYKKEPIIKVFSDYLNTFIKQGTITDQQKEIIINTWLEYINKTNK